MAEKRAIWQIVTNFSKARKDADRLARSLDKVQRETQEFNEESVAGDKAAIASGTKRTKVMKDLAAKRRELTKATKDATQADKISAQASEALARANDRVAQSEVARQRAALALEAAQKRLQKAEAQHGKSSQEYANALLSVQRKQIEVTSSSNRYASVLRNLEQVQQRIAQENEKTAGSFGNLGNSIRRTANDAMNFPGSMSGVLGILIKLSVKVPLVTVALGYLGTALSAVGAGAIALVGPLASLGSVAASLPQAFSVAAGAIGTFIGAFSGIGDALKSGMEAQKGAAQAATDTAKAEKAAAENIKRAQRGVRDAREAAADSARSHKRAVKDAAEAIVDAEKRQYEATKALSQARQDARRQIEDMATSLRDLAFQERGAAISVEESRQRLQEVMDDPGATDLQKRSAQLAYDEALARMEDVKKEKKRSDKDFAEAQKKGVKGSDQVVSAQEAEIEATKAVKDAQVALADARREQTQAARDSAEAIADAQRAVSDAQEAAAEASLAGAAAFSKYNEAMESLSPAGQRFVQLLLSMQDEVKRLKFAAQEGLLPGLGASIVKMTELLPIAEQGLYQFGKVIGGVAMRAANMLTSDAFMPMWSRLLESNTRLLELGGEAFLNLLEAVVYLMDAAAPFTEWLASTVVGWTEYWKNISIAGNKTGSTADHLNNVKDVLETLGGILKNVWGWFKAVGDAGGNALGMDLLHGLEKITKGWEDWANSTKGKNELKQWFDAARPVLHELSGLLGDITRMFFDLGRTGGDETASLISMVRDLIPKFTEFAEALQSTLGPSLVDLIGNIMDVLINLSSDGSSGLVVFVDTLNEFAVALNKILENEAAGSIIRFLAKSLAILAALKFMGVLAGLRGIFRGVSLLSKVFKKGGDGVSKFGKVFSGLKSVLSKVGGWIARFAGGFVKVFSKIGGFLAKAVAKMGGILMRIVSIVARVMMLLGRAMLANPWVLLIVALVAVVVLIVKYWDEIKAAVTKGIKAVWNWIKQNWNILKWLTGPFGVIITEIVKNWSDIKKRFSDGAKAVINFLKTVWSGIKDFIMNPVDSVRDLLSNAWDFISGGFSDLWGGVEDTASAFVKTIGGIWDDIRGAFATPIEWVVNTALDKWIIGNVNDLMGALGIDRQIPTVGPIHFARGGQVPGEGNRDSVPAMLMPGEFVLRRDAVKSIGVSRLTQMNEGRQRFAYGGSVRRRQTGAPAQYGFGDIVNSARDAGSGLWGSLKGSVSAVAGTVRDVSGRVIDFARTGASKGLAMLFKPLRALISGLGFAGAPGDMASGVANNLMDTAVAWVAGAKDVMAPGAAPVSGAPVGGRVADGINFRGYATGGLHKENVPALLTPGEFVLNRDAVARIGVSELQGMNRSGLSGAKVFEKRNIGGSRGRPQEPIQKFAKGGKVKKKKDRKKEKEEKKATTTATKSDLDKRLLGWIRDSEPKQERVNEKYTVEKGDRVGDVLKLFYGGKYADRLQKFLIANGYAEPPQPKAASGAAPSSAGNSGSTSATPVANSPLARALAFARGQHGKPYVWGGVGPSGYDCSGFQSAITNVIKGDYPYRRLFATGSMASALPGLGFQRGSGDYTVGWYTGSPGHTSGRLGSLNVESTGDHVRVGSTARAPESFPNVWSLRGLAGGTGLTVGQRAATKGQGKDKKWGLSSKLPDGKNVTVPDVMKWVGARTWDQSLKKFNTSPEEMVGLVQSILPKFENISKGKKSTFLKGFRNAKKGITAAGAPTDTGIEDGTPLEDYLKQQILENENMAKFQAALETIATWGFTDLIENLLEKGVEDGLPIATEAASNQALASRLNEQLKIAGNFSTEDLEKILKLVAYLSTAPGSPGLRDVARHLELSDYETVKLWEDGMKSGRFSRVPVAKSSRLTSDIAAYRGGTFYANTGGAVPGVGSGDTVPAMLTPGEFVIRKKAAEALGLERLWALNHAEKFASGGPVLAPSVASIPTNAVGNVSAKALAASGAQVNYNTTYDVDIINPVAEEGTRSMLKMLQRQSVLGKQGGGS